MRRLLVSATGLGLVLLLGACSAAPPASPVATDQVDLPRSYKFAPAAITVADGTTVTWTNNDVFTHSVQLLDDGGDILMMKPGESVSFTFDGVAEHRYNCSLHPQDMQGTVIVTDS